MESIPKAERNFNSTENNNASSLSGENNVGSQFYDYMLKKPYRNEDMFHLLTWIKPRIMGKPKKTVQLKPVFEISMMKSPIISSPSSKTPPAHPVTGTPIQTAASIYNT
jgi:hypothetical protein